MPAVHAPVLADDEVVGEPEHEVVGGHDPAGEEPTAHPGAVERVGVAQVGEDVHEEPAVVAQHPAHRVQERLPVAHVLEHLDRDDPVEAALRRERVDVGRDDLEIRMAEAVDERLLRGRVRDGEDPARGVVLGDPAGERAPAAAEVEHVHPVLDPGAGAGEREHRLLGVGERLDADGPEAARVLAPRPEREPEELGRELVVLVVRGAGLDRDRPRRHRRHHLLERVEPAPPLAVQAEAAVLRDRGAQERIGEDAPRDDPVGDHVAAGFAGAAAARRRDLFLVAPVVVAAAAQRLGLGLRDPRHLEEQHEQEHRHEDRHPAVRRRERDHGPRDPVQPLEEVVRMARPAPEAVAGRLALVGGVALPDGELRVGRHLAGDRRERERGAGPREPRHLALDRRRRRRTAARRPRRTPPGPGRRRRTSG